VDLVVFEWQASYLKHHKSHVGAAEGCDLLIPKKEQEIAAFGSSYRVPLHPHENGCSLTCSASVQVCVNDCHVRMVVIMLQLVTSSNDLLDTECSFLF
jgi:hypothetical protein